MLANLAGTLLATLGPQGRKRVLDLACRRLEEAAYLRLAERGFRPAAIIDVGAYHGEWTRMAHAVFPDTPGLMIEAQAAKEPHLARVKADLPRVDYALTGVGRTDGQEVSFFEMETGSSYFPEASDVGRVEKRLTLRTLDSVVAEHLGGEAPLFLKIDVQGAELEALHGGTETLARCEVVQLEVAMLPYNVGAPTMLEVIGFMDDRGLVPFDVSGFSRPNGRDLVQIDMLFAPKASKLRPDRFTFA